MYCCRLLRNHCSWAGGNCVFPAVSIPASFYPRGNEHLEEMDAGEWPVFRYRFGEVTLTRELMLIPA